MDGFGELTGIFKEQNPGTEVHQSFESTFAAILVARFLLGKTVEFAD